MKKRTVAIFANYDASEKTLCAVYLADQIIKRYRHVVWIVPEAILPYNRYYGFSHKWDAEVMPLNLKADKIYARLNEEDNACEACFFFDESEELYSLLPGSTNSAVFLDMYKWDAARSRGFTKRCNYALSVSPFVVKKIVNPNLLTNNFSFPFDPSVQMMPKVWVPPGENITLFYPAYGMSCCERQCVRQIADIVKSCYPNSKSAIGYYDNNETSEPGKDARAYDWRLMDYLKQTDWIIDLNPRPLMSLFACFAGSLSIQWSCFNIPPHTDEYNAARRHLIPYPNGGLAMTNAEEIADQIVRQLATPFNDDMSRNVRAGTYAKRLQDFGKAMNHLFGGKNW